MILAEGKEKPVSGYFSLPPRQCLEHCTLKSTRLQCPHVATGERLNVHPISGPLKRHIAGQQGRKGGVYSAKPNSDIQRFTITKGPVLSDLSLLSPLITGEDSLEGYSFPQIQSGETRLSAGGTALPSTRILLLCAEDRRQSLGRNGLNLTLWQGSCVL